MSAHADEYDRLLQQADDADAAGDAWTAGVLHERAYQLAMDLGRQQDAFDCIARAVRDWFFTTESDRGLKLLFEAQQQLAFARDATGRYWLQLALLEYAIGDGITTIDLDRQVDLLSEFAVHSWGYEGTHTLHMKAILLSRRGEWDEGLQAEERTWASRDDPGPRIYQSIIASHATYQSLRLGRRDEAQHWSELITTATNDGDSRWRHALCQTRLTLFDNDAPAARAASRHLDALVRSEQPRHAHDAAESAIRGLLLDPSEGDPARPDHLARLRFAHHQWADSPRFWFRYDWHLTLACVELAGVRHAAGMHPVDDLYYATPQTLPHPGDAHLPTEVLPRLAAFDRACDTALVSAVEADTCFGCTWRQQEVAALRHRGEAIAAVYRA